MVEVPYDAYKDDGEARVVFRNLTGSFAAKADLMLIPVDHKDRSSSGPQSESQLKPANAKLSISPNPTKDRITIEFSLRSTAQVEISLYDISGRKITSLYTSRLSRGDHNLSISIPDNLSSGIYFTILEAGDISCKEKLVIRH